MKTKTFIVFLLVLSNFSFAQVSGTIKIGDLFSKKKKENLNKEKNIVKFDYEKNLESKLSSYRYIEKILTDNDTIKFSESLKSRGYTIDTPINYASGFMGDPYQVTFLQFAIVNSNLKTIEYILKQGANPNLKVSTKWPEGNTTISNNAMYFARNSIEKIKLLINYRIDLNENKQMLEDYAKSSDFQYKQFISNIYDGKVSERILIEMATNYNDKQKINPELIKELVQKGAKVNVRYGNMDTLGNDTSMTLLMFFIENNFSFDNIKALIENGANVNEGKRRSSFENGRLPIHSAIIKNRIDVLKLLVEKGADINVFNDNYEKITPLAMAQKYKRTEMEDYLFMKGAN